MNDPEHQQEPPPDHFVRNLIIVIVIAVVGFLGYKVYENVQDTKDFNQQQIDDFGG